MSTSNEYRGILECPFQNGYVEFVYQKGDLVGELKRCLDAQWAEGASIFADTMFAVRHEWAFFAKDGPGTYVRLLLSEEIPAETDSLQAQDIPEILDDQIVHSAGRGSIPYIDMARYGDLLSFEASNYLEWMEKYDEAIKKTKFRFRFKLDRRDSVDDDKFYSVRLLALVAIVGG